MDPITDIFRTMDVTAFGLHWLEATAPWGVKQENQSEEKVTSSDKKISPTDLAHFAMLSRGNCWLSVEGVAEPIPLTGGDCFLLAKGASIALIRTHPVSTFFYVFKGLCVMTKPSPHVRHDDMFLQEHLAHRANPLRIDPGRLVSELLHVLNIRPGINRGMAVGAALAAQLQHA